jgi:hypothetical protein
MSTTTVFVEILIIGLEAMVWLGMALGIHWDTGLMMDFYKRNQSWSALLTPLMLALVYIAGIIVDRAADSLYKPLRYTYRSCMPAAAWQNFSNTNAAGCASPGRQFSTC